MDEFFINQILNIWGKYPNYAPASASPLLHGLDQFQYGVQEYPRNRRIQHR
ncbi:protein of unknown function [Paenibacillus alvei]|uniref:Uncharacterized protein n=1 Tax=Paenibacillus alvei TaxID=44250 RepID=A0A383R5L5_PAEAL|nr:protein of unknown function [Paenibacillus alvei]